MERALKEFENGIALSEDCQKTLSAAEKKVRMLTEKENIWEEKDYAETPENKQSHNLVKEYPTNTKPVTTENKQPQNPNIPKENLHSTGSKTDFFP